MLRRIDLRGTTLGRAELAATLPRAELDVGAAADAVAPVVEDVRLRGAVAVRDAAERFDGIRPIHLRVPAEALARAMELL
ncbi:MAG: histidinol dehydrogenase, partial [Actinomycetaceae bacterium]